MRVWIPPKPRVMPATPRKVDTICVLSRVTLGSDIKITSIILDAMKRRFPSARILFVASRKSAELFEADTRIETLTADYPRSGSVTKRIEFAQDLRRQLESPNCVVIDPDSRMTQLGLLPVCEPRHYFHFPSRTATGAGNLTVLTQRWLENIFGESGHAYIAPLRVLIDGEAPRAAISFGVGGNDAKRLGAEFEARLIGDLGVNYRTLWLDRGAGGEEAVRVTAAANASGCRERVRFWEGSFAGFTSIISQCNFYAGYDSAGQHAAAAAGVPLISYFAGAPSERFRLRWAPSGHAPIQIVPPV